MSQRQHPDFTQLIEVTHPLVQHKLSQLRSQDSTQKACRELVHEITLMIGYEATRQLPLSKAPITTPITTFDGAQLDCPTPVIVPILRAGLGMLDGLLALMPTAQVGFIGLFRNESTLEPESYYCKLPEHKAQQQVLLCDPMLATGGSAIKAISQIKNAGFTEITLLNIVSAPEGVARIQETHPDITLYTASLDKQLNQNGYIVPGLGDAGDRLYGTK